MKKKSAGFIILNSKWEILLGKTNWNPINSWTLFKGTSENGESLFQTAKRELKEEANIEIPDSLSEQEVFYKYKIKNKDVYLFIYHDLNDEIKVEELKCNSFWTGEKNDVHPEILEFGWFSLEEAYKKVLHSQKGLIKYLLSEEP